MTDASISSIDIAKQFATNGFSVFPLYKAKNGHKSTPWGWAGNTVKAEKADLAIPATTDLSIIETWPNLIARGYNSTVCGFGVLGKRSVILDLDMKNDVDGIASFKLLLKKYNLPKPTMTSVTKSKGLHIFYRRPDNLNDVWIKTMAGISIDSVKYPGVDLRGDGGYVVGPESLVEDLGTIPRGSYATKNLMSISQLPLFPAKILKNWSKTAMDDDLENLTMIQTDPKDFMALVRQGIIPDFIPLGYRNDAFFSFIGVLNSKGIPQDVIKEMCLKLAANVEDPETFAASVNITDMMERGFELRANDPSIIAAELISKGLFQLTGFRQRLHYIIFESNPYITSKNPHDETALKTLLKGYETLKENTKGKLKLVNPFDIIARTIGPANRVDMLGFKPKAGEVFSLHDEPGSRRFLNTFRPLTISHSKDQLNPDVWNEFQLLVTRLFGDKGSDDYQLGMDFLAWLIQKPEIKPSIAPFIMSTKRGVGKSLLFNLLISIMGTAKDGERQARIVKLDEITGRFFNPSGCIVNLIDEVQFPIHRDMRRESTTFWRHLKNLITSETVPVEIKGGVTYQSPNTAAIALAGNSGSYFPVEEFDRRIWIIDNNPPFLLLGEADHLFNLVKREGLSTDDRNIFVSTLRYHLSEWDIKTDLSVIRAPMTDVKQEMWIDGLTDIEEWFVTHFAKPGNLFSFNPIVSKSAIAYVLEQSSRFMDKDFEIYFRDIKRKGHIRPIRMASGKGSRQFNVPSIGVDGTLIDDNKREVLYTTREHGEFDGGEFNPICEAYMDNCATIKIWKKQIQARIGGKLTEAALL